MQHTFQYIRKENFFRTKETISQLNRKQIHNSIKRKQFHNSVIMKSFLDQ